MKDIPYSIDNLLARDPRDPIVLHFFRGQYVTNDFHIVEVDAKDDFGFGSPQAEGALITKGLIRWEEIGQEKTLSRLLRSVDTS